MCLKQHDDNIVYCWSLPVTQTLRLSLFFVNMWQYKLLEEWGKQAGQGHWGMEVGEEEQEVGTAGMSFMKDAL